jgi:hypothetical protein
MRARLAASTADRERRQHRSLDAEQIRFLIARAIARAIAWAIGRAIDSRAILAAIAHSPT